MAFLFIICEFGLSFILGYYPNKTFTIVYMWINMLYKYAYFNSEQLITICCIRNNIKIIYYPFLMVAIVCAVNMEIRWDALLAVIMGVI